MEKNRNFSKSEKSILIGSAIGILFCIFMAYNSLHGYPYIDLQLSLDIIGGAFVSLFIGSGLFVAFGLLNVWEYNKKTEIFRKELKEGDVANFGSDVVNILEIDGDEATIVVQVSKNRLYPLN